MSARDTAPIFVVGCPRSGTSMLYHMLLSSGHFPVYRTEPVVFDLLVPRFGELRRSGNRRKLMNCWLRSRQFRRSGLDARRTKQMVLCSVTNGGEFLRVIMDQMALSGGFRRWAVWGPDNLLHIPKIKEQIPNALFLHIIRDGRDVACALDRKRFIRPFPWDSNESLLVSALYWLWRVQSGRSYGREIGSDYLEIKYEDLVLRPSTALAKVSAFIAEELDYDRICRAKIGTLRVPNTSFEEELLSSRDFSPVGRWARLLPEPQVAQIENLIGKLLTELGYPLCCPRGGLSIQLEAMRALYPPFYDLKEWLKVRTPLGRFVDMSRLCLDEENDPVEVGELSRSDWRPQPSPLPE
jgi:Sulfotransferase family